MAQLPSRILTFIVAGAYMCCGWGLVRFTNFGPVNRINDIAIDSEAVYAATTGGLFVLENSGGAWRHYASTSDFPDVNITAVLPTSSESEIWVGSARGYLTRWTRRGSVGRYSSYAAAGWDITDLCSYDKYLIIGSSKGVSIFDTEKGYAIANGTKFGTFAHCAVRAVAVERGILHVGCEEGIASVEISGGKIRHLNFADRYIWSNRPTEEPVVAFVEYQNSLQGFSRPTVIFDGKVLQGDSVSIRYRGEKIFDLPSKVTCIAAQPQRCWIGTSENYLFEWSGTEEPVQHVLNGLSFGIIVRVAATPDGGCWALTQVYPNVSDNYSTPWNQGVVRYSPTDSFATYNEHNTTMGPLADFPQMRGLLVDRSGTVWVGASGGNVKRYDPPTNTWYQYYLSGMWVSSEFRLMSPTEFLYGKSDAFAQDSNGFIWISSFKNHAGCLIAYESQYIDPAGHFRRHLHKDSPEIGGAELNIISLCVALQRYICAGTEDGNLFILTYQNSPISEDVRLVDKFSGLVIVKDLAAAPDSILWAVCGQGLYRYDFRTRKLEKDTRIVEGLTSLEVEGPGKLWLGTQAGGLVAYSIADSQQTRLSADQGLINDAINDLSIDRKNGFLWVATYGGLSRYALMQGDVFIRNNSRVRTYPNPFSLSNPIHGDIVFLHLAPNSRILIYDMKGNVLQEVVPAIRNEREWTYLWRPGRELLPGTYLYSATSPSAERAVVGKVMIIP